MPRPPNTPEIFWSRVKVSKPSECWEWQGAITVAGYGVIKYHGRFCPAHRIAYFLTYGQISLEPQIDVTSNEFVLHACDNKKCCNPHHLHLGTLAENQMECRLRNRMIRAQGENHGRAKLSNEQVRSIRFMYSKGVKSTVIQNQFSISRSYVSKIVNFKRYSNID